MRPRVPRDPPYPIPPSANAVRAINRACDGTRLIRARPIRYVRPLVLALALLPLVGCHHVAPPASVPAADDVQIGYGSRNAKNVTGAVASATARGMGDFRTGRVEEMLIGRFAGVDVVPLPNGHFSIQIRGRRSFNGENQPLIVVDGIPSPPGLSNPLQDLAPQNVARIDVLKDAGATAVYGARGANGVIVITTRR
jgi:TonB-dependent SusC/RagA subfamily outer membrane receptor